MLTSVRMRSNHNTNSCVGICDLVNETMRKVLLVTYEYPPIGGTGMIRVLKFSKYLEQFGWKSHILTVRNRDRFYTSAGLDKIPSSVKVHRAWNPVNNLSLLEGGLRRLGLDRRLLVPDVFVGWVPSAIKAGKCIIDREEIDLIYVTCPIFSAAKIGINLKNATGLPFILDLRDAWTLGPHPIPYLHSGLAKVERQLEREALTAANWIISATPGISDAYLKKYPFIRDRLSTILNGFDLDDIPTSSEQFQKFTITYTGFFYGARSPERFLAALGRIAKERLIPEDEIQFVWAGRPAPFVWDMIRTEGIESIVNYIGLVPKAEADALLYRSHLLFLLPFAEVEQEKEQQVLTGKIFPYLASGRPILGLMPEGDAKRMIEKYSETSYIISSGDVNEIVQAILDAYFRWKAGSLVLEPSSKTLAFREENNVKNRTKELAQVFNKVIPN